MTKYTFTKEQVEEAIVRSSNIKTLLMNLGLKVNNGNYRNVRAIVQNVGVEWPEFNYSGGTASAIFRNTIPAEEFFSKGVLRNGRNAKARLIKNHGFVDECSECGCGPVWNGKPLTLQLDHIDGDRFNNEIDNLRIICPNCHTQTETYSNNGGNKNKRYNYCECGVRVSKNSLRCRSCDSKSRVGKTKITWPPVEDVLDLVQRTNYLQAGKALGVSDNAVRKFLQRNS